MPTLKADFERGYNDMKKFVVCDSWGHDLKKFDSKDAAEKWLEKYAYHNGVQWIVYDVSRFPFKLSSRALYVFAE